MKKILALAFLTILITNAASSQILIALLFGDKLNGEKVEFGLNIGGNYSTLSNVNSNKNSPGLNIGMNFLFKINDRFHINPALFFAYPMGANKLPLYETPDTNLNKVLENANLQRKLSYFSLPVTMRYRLFGLTYIEAGPQVSLKTKAIDVFTIDIDGDNKLVYSENVRDKYTLFDFGVTAGITQKLRKKGGVSISLKYYKGLIDVSKDAAYPNQKNEVFYFIVAIPIGGNPKEKEVEK